MKSKILTAIMALLLFVTWSCDEYLDKIEVADLTEEDVFSTYLDYQAFVDQMYDKVIANFNFINNVGKNWADHVISNGTGRPGIYMDQGNYWMIWTSNRSLFHDQQGDGSYEGLWDSSLKGIRIANLALEHYDLLKDATQEQRDLLLGQIYFFRAFFHYKIISNFGGVPYMDRVFSPNDDMRLPRLTYQQTTERMVEDLDVAISLLPADWEETETGRLRAGFNRGRATKGAALALKTKALIFAASPLMNNESTGRGFVYDHQLLQRAAEAGHQFFKLVDQGYYALESIETYTNSFYTMDGTVTWGPEVVWQRTNWIGRHGQTAFRTAGMGRLIMGGRLGQVNYCEAPTQNIVDQFEMQSTGLPIDDPESGWDPAKPWDGLDPRFNKSILTDRTRWVASIPASDPRAYIQLYNGGLDRGTEASLSGYLIKKFWPYGANQIDAQYALYWHRVPILRVPDIYLLYAEAVNEIHGPQGVPNFAGETGLTALQAINVLRTRAEMPGVHSKFTGSKEAFRERIRVERSVELCFEGHRWYDVRRWHIGHLPETKVLYGMDFDRDHTNFARVVLRERVFDDKHYWLPFPRDQVNLYEEFTQNPGW
jgi:starch-binding outer membrane protein, SusD/RagB family